MKTLKLFFGLLIVGILLSSCVVENNHYHDEPENISLEEVLTANDIWYVDYNSTTGSGSVPFVSKAFTLSFYNGNMYANNNIVGLGFTGDGYGILTGIYDTDSGFLEIDHDLDGYYKFEVIVDSPKHIRLHNANENVTYYLDGYSVDNFDYDKLYYDNIEYFLQEYVAWNKSYTSVTGELNDFDYENYLAFTPENNTTFYSSQDEEGTPISALLWDFEGTYEIYDINGYENLKVLTLDYDSGYNEEFELRVISDVRIELYHINSGTTYEFDANGFIEYKNKNNSKKDRNRTIIKRKSVNKKPHKKVNITRK